MSKKQDEEFQFFENGKAWKACIGVPKKGDQFLHKDLHFVCRAPQDFKPADVCIILFDPTPET